MMTHAEYEATGAWRLYHAQGYAEMLPARPGAIYSATGRALARWAEAAQQDERKQLIAEAKTKDVLKAAL